MESLIQDLRYAVRTLARSPTLTLAAVCCFALGIGVNATMFGVVDTLMFRAPSHVRDPGRVVRLYFTNTSMLFGRFTQPNTSYPNFTDIRDGVTAFGRVAAFWTRETEVGRGPGASQVRGSLVSASYFPLLGVRPALGRFFDVDEDRPGGATVAVLGYGYWRRRFGGDSAALGRTLQIGRALYTIIGVAPEGFTGADLQAVDLWLPVAVAGTSLMADDALTNRGDTWIELLARLKPGVTAAQAAVEATLVYRRGDAAEIWKDPNATVEAGPIEAARGPSASDGARLSLWLAAVSAMVLLIACANVANLLLARALRRRREVALRLALGAGRGRLARQLLTESLALAMLGGAAALLVALWTGPVIRAYVLPKDALVGPVLDPRVLAFTALIALVTGALSGVLPALQASRPDLTVALKTGEREGTYQRSRVRAGLLVAQTSLTLVLLAGTGLFVRSLRNVLRIDIGLDAPRVMVADVNVFNLGYTRSQVDALFQRLLERARTVPGVERAALSFGGPFGWQFGHAFRVPGLDSVPLPKSGGPYINGVTPGFFATLGTRILRGRGFTDADVAGSAKVAVVGETMARRLWPRGDALGKCIILGGDSACTEVVGIAADQIRYSPTEDVKLQYYVPIGQQPNVNRTLWVRTRGDPHLLVADVQHALAASAPDLPYVSVRPLEDLVQLEYRPWRMGATVFGLFGGLALVLAALGLYGVLAYTVAQRTQELGVRIALGALPRDVFRLVVGQGLAIAAIGATLGVLLALAAGKLLASLLYGISPGDPLVLAAAAAVLLAAAAAASWFPARRATKVDPVVALRSE
jgi:putative ABC transport system permease protein